MSKIIIVVCDLHLDKSDLQEQSSTFYAMVTNTSLLNADNDCVRNCISFHRNEANN